MTVAEVKRDLPAVPVVTASGQRFMARVSGRQCQFACVTLDYLHHETNPKRYLRGPAWRDVHFSWEAVARAVTTGNPLQFDS